MEIEKFQNTLIAFDTSNEMVNATDMIRAFPEKRMNDFLRLKGTKEFISLLENNAGIPVFKSQQGVNGGTWMNKWLAYEFAAWLSPEFRLFVYQTFDSFHKEQMRLLQIENGYLSNRADIEDLYPKKK